MADIFAAPKVPRVKRRKPPPPPAPPAFVNTAKGNPRAGQRFDVVNRSGVRYHRYANGLLIADKAKGTGTSTPEEAKAKGVAEVPTPGAPKPPPPASPPRPTTGMGAVRGLGARTPGALVNRVKGNPRFGQTYETVTKGGQTFHRYKGGQMIAVGKRDSSPPKDRTRKPPAWRFSSSGPPPRFTTNAAARAWHKRHPRARY